MNFINRRSIDEYLSSIRSDSVVSDHAAKHKMRKDKKKRTYYIQKTMLLKLNNIIEDKLTRLLEAYPTNVALKEHLNKVPVKVRLYMVRTQTFARKYLPISCENVHLINVYLATCVEDILKECHRLLSATNKRTLTINILNMAQIHKKKDTTPIKRTTYIDNKKLRITKGGGDCAYHAAFGTLVGVQIQVNDINELRNQYTKMLLHLQPFEEIRAKTKPYVIDLMKSFWSGGKPPKVVDSESDLDIAWGEIVKLQDEESRLHQESTRLIMENIEIDWSAHNLKTEKERKNFINKDKNTFWNNLKLDKSEHDAKVNSIKHELNKKVKTFYQQPDLWQLFMNYTIENKHYHLYHEELYFLSQLGKRNIHTYSTNLLTQEIEPLATFRYEEGSLVIRGTDFVMDIPQMDSVHIVHNGSSHYIRYE